MWERIVACCLAALLTVGLTGCDADGDTEETIVVTRTSIVTKATTEHAEGESSVTDGDKDTTTKGDKDTTTKGDKDTTAKGGKDTTTNKDTTAKGGKDTTTNKDTTAKGGKDTTAKGGKDTTAKGGKDTTAGSGKETTNATSSSKNSTPNTKTEDTTMNKETSTTKPIVGEMQSIDLNSSHIAYLGRVAPTEKIARMEWPGTGFEIAVRGGTVKANLSGIAKKASNPMYVAIYVDGERTQKIELKKGTNEWYTLADNLPTDRVTTVRVVKLNEGTHGSIELQGLKVDGTLENPTLPNRRIIWIGDSISCGFGVLGQTSTEAFSTRTQDITLTYGWLLSDVFNAQRHIIAASGHGVATANTGSTTDQLIPLLYSQTGFTNTTLWNHSQYQPDLIVVNLGTNDAVGKTTADRLREGVRSFVTQLKTAHPSATIVWVYGFMRDDFADDIKQEVEALGGHFLKAYTIEEGEDMGSRYHPSDDAHAKLAQNLEPQLRSIMGW